MAPAVSKLTPLPFNCYELGHTWTPHCSRAAYDLGIFCFRESLKIYTSVYVFSLLATRRIPRNGEDIKKLLINILRSSTFLSANGVMFIHFFCLIRKILGSFNFYTIGYIPTFLAAYVAIQFEKHQRRPLLALYVANVASETIFRMMRTRGIVKNIKNFDVFLFCSSATTILYYMKKGIKRNDIVDSIMRKIVGPEEFLKKDCSHIRERGIERIFETREDINVAAAGIDMDQIERPEGNAQNGVPRTNETYRMRFVRFVFWMHKAVEDIACHLERMVNAVNEGKTHDTCPHLNPCLEYWLQGFWTRFLTGFGIQGALQTFLNLKALLSGKGQRSKFGDFMKTSLKSGLGLSSMCFFFRLLSCSFRWLQGSDSPKNAIPSGIFASVLGYTLIRPPPTLGLYLFFKGLETVISESHKTKNWKIINWIDSLWGGGWCLLYAASTAMLFHAGMLEPQNLKPSYFHFLSRVTGRKLYDINRHLFAVYGTNSNALMKNFWPNFDLRFVSPYMKILLEDRAVLGKGNEFMSELTLKFLPGYS